MKVVVVVITFLLLSSSAAVCSPPLGETGTAQEKYLYLVATAHLDTQWRWTIQKTIDEFIPATFLVNAKFIEEFPGYTFSFEGAFRYMLLQEYYPDYYKRLKQYVANGRWRLAGSWVDAVDVNVPSPESLIRHALYGNGFFKKEFGKTTRDVYLPDCFGFGYALPSIAAHCGITSFSSQKLTWGSWVGVPFDIGVWEGVDGSSLIAALNPGDYVSRFRSDLSRDSTVIDIIDRQGESSGLYAAYRYFGTGDQGGGPDSVSVAWVQKSIDGDGPVEVRNVGTDDLTGFITPEQRENLPRYKGELLMTRHGVGCYTSQAAMKRWNRKNELLADAAERASVTAHLLGGAEYPRDFLKKVWVRFLWHQFHDDLTGTSIPEAYEFSWNDEILCLNQFASILEHAVEATAPALDTRVKGVPLVVFNPLSIPREDIVEATADFEGEPPDAVRVFNHRGDEVPSQVSGKDDGGLRVIFLASVPSVGYAVYDVRPSKSPCDIKTGLRATGSTLENKRYLVRIDENGDVASVFDKALDRELLSGPLQLQLLRDKPLRWAAWEIDYDAITSDPSAIVGGKPQIRIVEEGPARASIEVTREYGSSTFRQTISLAGGEAGERVEIENVIDWYERETLLKAAFPFTSANEKVTYDLGLGCIERGINKPELYEVPGQQWADMTSRAGDHGVAVLNDCKYGWDHPDAGTLRLTLIHTPGVYENWAWIDDQRSQDNGRHEFTYAIHGHRGGWREGAVQWQAARLNQPLHTFQTGKHKGAVGKSYSLLDVTTSSEPQDKHAPQAAVRALKLAEDSGEVIVRLQELHGKPAENVRVRFERAVVSAREVNGAEEPLGGAGISDGVLTVFLKPFQPRAFALTLEKAKDVRLTQPSSLPVELPFDLDGISLDSDRLDGDLDGRGNSLSGDLLPDTLVRHGVSFVFGPKRRGAKNVMSCSGQTLALPKGDYNVVYLLTSAAGGPAGGKFSAGDRSTEVRVQDYSEPVGQWDNRMVTGVFADEIGSIAPAYINRAPVAWAGTHRHSATGKNEAYRFTYLYMVRLDLPRGAAVFTLPDNPRIKLMAATLAGTPGEEARPAQPLYDVAHNTLTRIHANRFDFLHDIFFEVTCPVPGAEIFYTLDGSDPTPRSSRYTGPVRLTETTKVKTRAFLAGAENNFVTEVDFTRLVPHDPVQVEKVAAGLRGSYYEGEWSELPDFDTLTARQKFVAASATIPAIARDEDYGLVFNGYVRIEREGLYDFSITSDDGSRLYVAGLLVADNDGLHGAHEVTGAIALKPGLHAIEAYMFQRKGGEALKVSIEGPGLDKRPVPAGMFFHAEDVRKR